MSVNQPPNIYREQLSSEYQGLALWDPKPVENLFKEPPHVSIGDVGYQDRGAFIRIFNVKLSREDQLNTLIEIPEGYKPLKQEHFENVRRGEVPQEEYCSHVSKVDNRHAKTHDDDMGQTYECWARSQGALLSLPHGARSEDVIRTKLFEDYIRDNVDSWFRWSKDAGLPVKNMEDLILVTGCTLATSWAAAAFDSSTLRGSDLQTISLEARKSDCGGAQFVWRNNNGGVAHHHSDSNVEGSPPENQCVFIRGFRAKRRLFWVKHLRAAAEPLPDPDNRQEIQVSRIPGGSKYRDPLVGVLDYIIQKCREDVSAAENTIAIAHDDDLQFIEGVETLTADAVENFLHEKQLPLLIENGAAILRDPAENDNGSPVSDDKKAIFYAAAELNGEPVQLDIHPVLTKYNLKLNMAESPDDYDLPKEEMNSPAVYPHTQSLRLVYFQGYPQVISIDASSDSQGADITVQDVLRMIHEDLRKPSSKRELGTFARGEQNAIRDIFRKRCNSEEERSKGLYRIDYLRGRDRLQILPRLPLDGASVPIPVTQPSDILDQSNVAGPSRFPA